MSCLIVLLPRLFFLPNFWKDEIISKCFLQYRIEDILILLNSVNVDFLQLGIWTKEFDKYVICGKGHDIDFLILPGVLPPLFNVYC